MKLLASIILLLVHTNLSAQKFSEQQLNDIHEFLVGFGTAVENRDSLELVNYVVPLNISGNNYQEEAIQRILNDQKTLGSDFEYSPEAFSFLRDSLYIHFKPINEEVRNFFENTNEAKVYLERYSDDQIVVLFQERTIVVLILGERRIQLFFTEGMNYLPAE
jgi:hypothetical protein